MILKYKNSSINYEVHGSGDTILLLHGFLENLSMWDEFTAILSQSHKVITTDLLGHGKTDSIGYIHTMEEMAEAVYAVLSNLNISEVKVIGHSMGGYVALAMAELYPNFITDLCLMNSTFLGDDKDRIKLRKSASEMAKTNYKTLISTSFKNLFATQSISKYKVAYNEALNIALQTSIQGYIAAQEGMAKRPNRFQIFKAITGKKYIILGKKDLLINIDNIKDHIINTRIELFETSEGHMSHIENKSDLSYIFKHYIEK
ncbi:alpha/beta fold hydrolase [Winogradskyella poriferorum]|uniref:alpha/beta fold hydrolase n=1 Tax=Winogradskyella poriferorum TaxID=307627 RepID=UPI003D645E8A